MDLILELYNTIFYFLFIVNTAYNLYQGVTFYISFYIYSSLGSNNLYFIFYLWFYTSIKGVIILFCNFFYLLFAGSRHFIIFTYYLHVILFTIVSDHFIYFCINFLHIFILGSKNFHLFARLFFISLLVSKNLIFISLIFLLVSSYIYIFTYCLYSILLIRE